LAQILLWNKAEEEEDQYRDVNIGDDATDPGDKFLFDSRSLNIDYIIV